MANVQRCWASLFSVPALSYRLEHGMSLASISMAVVVQEMIAAKVSGVAFSVHPLSNRADEIMIEATAGVSEHPTAGKIAPDSDVVRKGTLEILAEQVQLGKVGRQSEPNPADEGEKSDAVGDLKKLNSDQIGKLAELVTAVEGFFDFPVDIEWALAGGVFNLLQARPITGLSNQINDTDIWSNLNIAEVLPGINPPLVTDFLIDVLEPPIRTIKLFPFPGDKPILRSIKGRLYFNMTAVEQGLSSVFVGKTDELNITKLLGGEQKEKPVLEQIDLRAKLKLARFAARILFDSKKLQREYDRFVGQARRSVVANLDRVNQADALTDLIHLEEELHRIGAGFAKTAFGMIMSPISHFFLFSKISRRWLDKKNPALSRLLLAGGGADRQPVEAMADLWGVRDRIKLNPILTDRFLDTASTADAVTVLEEDPDVFSDYVEFITEHGHRCAKELDFSLPRWREDPTFIIDVLKNYVRADDSHAPRRRQELLRSLRERTERELAETLPWWKRKTIKRLVRLASAGQQKRENLKSEVVRLLLPMRANLLKIGKILHDDKVLKSPDDVFMFHLNELRSLADPDQDILPFSRIISARKALYGKFAELDLPGVISAADEPVSQIMRPATAPSPGDSCLKGIAVSHGIVEGRVRLIESVADIGRLEPGDILLTDHTDPGWTPVFVTVKGIITNTGGLISHTSIVAREYGVPAVVNVARATELIPDGRNIVLDADTGTITIKALEPERAVHASPDLSAAPA